MPRGNPKGVGRPKGAKNKATAEVKELAREYTAEALETLVSVMGDVSGPAAARVAAANTILDRGHGKPMATVEVRRSPLDSLEANELRVIADAIAALTGRTLGVTDGSVGTAGEEEVSGIQPIH